MTDTPPDALSKIRRYSDYPYTSPDTLVVDSEMVRITADDLAAVVHLVDAHAAEVARLTDELEEQVERIEELEAACEVVSSEFEGELWRVCRQLLEKTGFDIRAYEPDGIQAEAFDEHMNDVLLERDALRAQLEEANALLAEASDDLASYVDNDYPPVSRKQYPDIARRHHRDMELVRRIAAYRAAQYTIKEPTDK